MTTTTVHTRFGETIKIYEDADGALEIMLIRPSEHGPHLQPNAPNGDRPCRIYMPQVGIPGVIGLGIHIDVNKARDDVLQEAWDHRFDQAKELDYFHEKEIEEIEE